VHFRQAQVAPAALPEFKGTVRAVETAAFWDDDLDALQQRMEQLDHKLRQDFKTAPKPSQAARDEARKKAIDAEFRPGVPLPRRGQDPGADRYGIRRRPAPRSTRAGAAGQGRGQADRRVRARQGDHGDPVKAHQAGVLPADL
jgi:hypothetical protein